MLNILKKDTDRRAPRKGFTLAETLFVLVIIGGIAALTIVPLIKNSWASEQKTAFKNAYSMMNSAVNGVKAELGYMPDCYYDYSGTINHNTECITVFHPAFKRQLSIIKTCDSNALSDGCIPVFNGAEVILKQQNPALSDADALTAAGPYYRTSFLQTSVPTIVLKNGVSIMSVSNWNDAANYVVDINGKRGPNKWGYDIFTFVIMSDGNAVKITGPGRHETGGKTFDEMMKYAFE